MPTYTYECKSCNNIVEKIFEINVSPNTIFCEFCGKEMEKIIVPGASFILKGGGWPGKDSKEKNYRQERNNELSDVMNQKREAGESVTKISDLKKVK
ncbi:MAG: FmdB family zinc ribbon protein [Acidithiobacillus sp.]|jgi:putative FmdB family regulatory protein|uniref:FmdB family zinc ribbon protein n=1 Tax=Acidithiobacillus sp. TaxID=1872118 RepID=UPI003560558E